MAKVLVTAAGLAGVPGGHLEMLRNAGLEVAFPKSKKPQLTEDDMLHELVGVAATLASTEPYTPRVLSSPAAKDLRVIARVGVGYDSVDVAAATEAGVAVTITPGANHDAVAEHAMALILGLAKDVARQDRGTRAGKWPRQSNLPLRGKTVGLLGLGRIGRAVAIRLVPFGVRIIAYEPYPDADFVARNKIELMSFEMVMAESDFVSLHLPMCAETKYTICKKSLSLMKPTAYLVNTSRGGLVCEADLLEALQNKKIAGAGLDVLEVEPALENPLFAYENVLLSPHTAGVDMKSLSDMAVMAARSIVLISKGEWPAEQIVNPEVKSRFRW